MDGTLNIALSLWGGLKFPYIIPKTKYFLANFYGNTFLRMSKLKVWLTKRSKSAICLKMSIFEHTLLFYNILT